MVIITRLQGGLGNQLFQYAAGRALAKELNRPLLLDEQWFSMKHDGVTVRASVLPHLNIIGKFIKLDRWFSAPKRLRRFFQVWLPLKFLIVQEKKEYLFDGSLLKMKPFVRQSVYLSGYWQSFKYFEKIRMELLSEVVLRAPLSEHYCQYLDEIKSKPVSVMVHIRRGDYISLPAAAKVHGVLGLNYYIRAMTKMVEHGAQEGKNQTHFFVFSDDIAWARAHLPYQDRTTFIENLDNETAAIEELQLMRSCDHHIIANSSLSWWGAWLCDHVNQRVICPRNWVNRDNLTYDDLLPPSWERLAIDDSDSSC